MWAVRASKVHPDSVVTWTRTTHGLGLLPSVLIVTGNEVVWVKRRVIGASVMRTERKNVRSSDFAAGLFWDGLYLEVDDEAFPLFKFRLSKDYRDELYGVLFHLKQDEV